MGYRLWVIGESKAENHCLSQRAQRAYGNCYWLLVICDLSLAPDY